MKKSELRQIIREEIKSLNEDYGNQYTDMASSNKEMGELNESSPFEEKVFFGIYSTIFRNSKNSRLKNYSADIAHQLVDIFERIEYNELTIGEFFTKIKKI